MNHNVYNISVSGKIVLLKMPLWYRKLNWNKKAQNICEALTTFVKNDIHVYKIPCWLKASENSKLCCPVIQFLVFIWYGCIVWQYLIHCFYFPSRQAVRQAYKLLCSENVRYSRVTCDVIIFLSPKLKSHQSYDTLIRHKRG